MQQLCVCLFGKSNTMVQQSFDNISTRGKFMEVSITTTSREQENLLVVRIAKSWVIQKGSWHHKLRLKQLLDSMQVLKGHKLTYTTECNGRYRYLDSIKSNSQYESNYRSKGCNSCRIFYFYMDIYGPMNLTNQLLSLQRSKAFHPKLYRK